MADFDHWPLIEGASVPLRRHVSAPDGRDQLEFGLSTGEGEIDGEKFDVVGTHGANIEVRFKDPGMGENGGDDVRFYVSVRDVVRAAHAQLLKDRELNREVE